MKTCFVIQGYGRKTDYRDGRVLDLDASYAIIKDAVEAVGLECLRADEIQHSGATDLAMYERLLEADLVVADLSTYNVNTAFELGVRYALRPHATIIVAEELFQNPFDFSHITIRRYKHLGDDIGAKEARRFGDELKAAITAIAAELRIDSPIYTFLPHLKPPLDQRAADDEVLAPFAPLPTAAPETQLPPGATMAKERGADTEAVDLNTKQLIEQAQKRINESDFASARMLLEEARKRRPTDSFVLQRLALAIYKSKLPDAVTALKAGQRDDAITDHTLAIRMRRDVTQIARAHLERLPEDIGNERYWVLASLWEAALGTGDSVALAGYEGQPRALDAAQWMQDTWQWQGKKLRALLEEYALPMQG